MFENDWAYDIKMVDELIDLIVEIMTLPDTTTVRIGGIEKKCSSGKKPVYEAEKSTYRVCDKLPEEKYDQNQ